MREDKLYNISGNGASIILSIAGAVLLSLTASHFYQPGSTGENFQLPIFEGFPAYLRIVINLGAILLSSLLLLWINNSYTIVKAHSSLPLLFFLLFECSNPELITDVRTGNILVPFMLLSLSLLYGTYQSSRPQNQSFAFALLISGGALLWSPFIFLLPLFWIGLYLTRALDLKSFFASLTGVAAVLWLFFGGHFIWGYPLFLEDAFRSSISVKLVHEYGSFSQLLYFIPTVVLGFIAGISSLYGQYNDKISTRVYNEFINILSLFTALFIGLNISGINNALPLLNVCVAMQAAHLFNNITNKWMVYLFYSILILYLFFYLWILLQDLVSGVI